MTPEITLGRHGTALMLLVPVLFSCTRDSAPTKSAAAPTDSAVVAHPAADDTLWISPWEKREAAITAKTTVDDLVRRFGAPNVRDERIGVGEGAEVPGVVVFPLDSEKRVELMWSDSTRKDHFSTVQLYGSKSTWHVGPAISLGTTLEQIEVMNGKPLTLNGFYWDLGGTISDYHGGRLTALRDGVPSIFFQFSPCRESAASESEISAISGDRAIESSDPVVKKVQPCVQKIVVVFERGSD